MALFMTDPYSPRTFNTFRITKIPGWAMLFVALLAGALGIGMFLLSASILLVLTPFIVVGALIIQWRIRRALRQAAREADVTSIDVEYRVIDTQKDR
jgi:hypothetical protein